MLSRSLIDGHVQAEGLRDVDLETLARFGLEQVLVCSHDGGLPRPDKPTVRDWLSHYERLLTFHAARFKRHGLRPLFALGIHPAAAPWIGLEELLHKLPLYLSDPAVVAVGALGLRHFDEQEAYVLRRQLELAVELRRPVLVSGPVREPTKGIRKLVALLKEVEMPPSQVLVEQPTRASLPLLRACGLFVALESSPGRLSVLDISRNIRAFGAERSVLTSHAGEGAANLLAVPMLVERLSEDGLSEAVIARLARENLLRFLRREESVRAARVG
jgi:predicted metal-dependent TIM-barrel fold hydrolase